MTVYKQMSSGLLKKDITYKIFAYKLHTHSHIYIYVCVCVCVCVCDL